MFGIKQIKIKIPLIPYLVITGFAFYVMPTLSKDTTIFKYVLVPGIPLFCFIFAFLFGYKNGFHLIYPILMAVLFSPTVFFTLDVFSAIIYMIIFGAIALAGNHFGSLIASRGN